MKRVFLCKLRKCGRATIVNASNMWKMETETTFFWLTIYDIRPSERKSTQQNLSKVEICYVECALKI